MVHQQKYGSKFGSQQTEEIGSRKPTRPSSKLTLIATSRVRAKSLCGPHVTEDFKFDVTRWSIQSHLRKLLTYTLRVLHAVGNQASSCRRSCEHSIFDSKLHHSVRQSRRGWQYSQRRFSGNYAGSDLVVHGFASFALGHSGHCILAVSSLPGVTRLV